jgi:hypothetical protein
MAGPSAAAARLRESGIYLRDCASMGAAVA